METDESTDNLALGYSRLQLHIHTPNLEEIWLEGYTQGHQEYAKNTKFGMMVGGLAFMVTIHYSMITISTHHQNLQTPTTLNLTLPPSNHLSINSTHIVSLPEL